MSKEIDVKTNSEVLALCDGALDEDVCVFVPVKTLRRLLQESEILKQIPQKLGGHGSIWG